MLYSESTHDIYQQLYNLPNFNLKLTNELITVDFLDKKFTFQNGDKDLQFDDLNMAAQIICAKYYDKWNTYINSILAKNIPLGETTTTETVGNTNDNISAMDTATNVPVSGQDIHNTTTTNVQNASNVGDMLLLYQKYSIYDTIDIDIRRTLFLNVY